uniref:Tail protein n=1 Tax=Staphylococcus phage vB_SauP_PSK TaxID=3240362 RepID=A0AB39U1P7_9CAUD
MAFNENDFKYFDDIRPFIDEIYKTRERYTPFYDDRADYNTNSKSYYDYLSKLSRLIEVLAHRIWEYDDELKKRFKNWDDLMKAFPDQAKDLFRGWLNDGTIDKIIHDEFIKYSTGLTTAFALFKASEIKQMNDFKAEVKDLIKDIDRFVNGFELNELEPKFVTGFGGVRNAVNQSILIDRETNQMYSTQSDTQEPEGFWINKLTPSGDLISSMRIVEGGHGTSIALERKSNGEIKLWIYHTGLSKLIQVPYRDDTTLTLEDAKTFTDFTPKSSHEYFTPIMDEENDKLVFRYGSGLIQVRSREDVINHIDNVEKELQIDVEENTPDRPMQGIAVYGDDLYWLSGRSSLDSKTLIQKYSFKTKSKVYDYYLNDVSFEHGVENPRDNFREPEGLYLYVNPRTKKQSLLIAYTTAGGGKRQNLLYGFFQTGEYERFVGLTLKGGQNYKLTKDDGRSLSIRDGVTSLKEITETGFYYMMSEHVRILKDFPYKSDSGWFLFVSPKTQQLGGYQELTRFSFSRKMIKFIRSFSYNLNTQKYEFGSWTTISTNSVEKEYINAEDYGFWIAKITLPGEYYITSTQMGLFKDAPSDIGEAGAWLQVSSGNVSGEVRQTLIVNSSTYKEYYSLVLVENTHRQYDWVPKHK